ncbi:MAG: YCF48-related protein [Candidatus Thorarchaeota archaeon]
MRRYSCLLILLIVGCGLNSHSSSISLVEKQSFTPMQAPATWQIQDHSYFHEDTTFRDVCFINSTHGWVVGQNKTGLGGGIILNTEDAGNSWNLQLYNNSHWFSSIDIIDDQTMWVTGTGGFVYTTNGGQTWIESKVIDVGAGMGAVTFINKTHGWTSTMNDLYKTTNGGQTWQNITSWTFTDSLRMIHFVSSSEAWAIGFSGIYYTDDVCEHWKQQYSQGGWSLSFLSATEAWAVADSWLARMVDGETWIEQPTPRSASGLGLSSLPYFTDVFFIDQMHGWLAGLETPVAFTPNGGSTWYAQHVPDEVDRRMMAVHFVNNTHGWVVGHGGYIMRTTNGNGLGVRLQTTFETSYLYIGIGVLAIVIVAVSVVLYYQRSRKTSYTSH